MAIPEETLALTAATWSGAALGGLVASIVVTLIARRVKAARTRDALRPPKRLS